MFKVRERIENWKKKIVRKWLFASLEEAIKYDHSLRDLLFQSIEHMVNDKAEKVFDERIEKIEIMKRSDDSLLPEDTKYYVRKNF